jgi:hypothetical protein
MMMGPRTYVNINDGSRERMALFAEWEQKLDARWTTLVGVRDELVRTDAGNVQPYGTGMMNMNDLMAANAFNARDHARRDNNIDLTALARLEADAGQTYEFGYARKTRSPNPVRALHLGPRHHGHDHDQLVRRWQRLCRQYRPQAGGGAYAVGHGGLAQRGQ